MVTPVGRRARDGTVRVWPVLLLAVLLLPTAVAAGDIMRLYGDENVGTAGAQFLRIPVGARAVALGQAYTACATDGSSPFWNPAGLVRTPGRRNLFFAHNSYTADIDLEYASYHWHGQNFGYGLFAGMLLSGEIPRTTELHQEGTGQTFEANQYVLGFSLARAMTDRFSFGASVKYFQENLDEFTTRGALFDLGILYFIGVGDLRVGFAVRNIGADLRPGGTPPELGPGYVPPTEFQSYAAPTSGSFGVAYTWRLGGKTALLTTADFHHPTDYSESFRLGSELELDRRLALRGGYETNRDQGGLAAGFGVRLARDRWDIHLDYALRDMGRFGTVHQVSLDLSPLWRTRRGER